MKPLAYSILALSAIALQHASAALLIQETFNYSAGTNLSTASNTTATGTGLTGNWATFGPSQFTIQEASLGFTGHFAASGGSLLLTGTNPFGLSNASAAVSATLTGSSTLYTSSIMTLNTAGTYFMDWVLEQRFSTDPNGNHTASSGRNLLSAYEGSGVSVTAARNAGVSSNSSEVVLTDSINPGTNYLFVTAYSVTGSTITDTTLHVFDQASYGDFLLNSNAGNADANLGAYDLFTLTDTDDASLDNFDFLQFSMQGGPVGQMDDFRLGNQITDVVNVVPEPSVALLGGFGMLGLLRRRRR